MLNGYVHTTTTTAAAAAAGAPTLEEKPLWGDT